MLCDDGRRGNGLKLHQERFGLDIGRSFFPGGAVGHWTRLPRAVVQSPSLEVFKKHVNMALGDMILLAWWCWVDGWT